MVQLAQIFLVYISVAVVKCHVFFGTDHRRVHHDISDLPQMISHLINQHLGHGYPKPYNHGLNRPGFGRPGSGNINLGSPSYGLTYNRPSNIFGGNWFGSPDYTSQEGPSSSEESGEPLSQNPNSGEQLANIQISQVPPISDGISGEVFDDNQPNNFNVGSDVPNSQTVDLPGEGIKDDENIPNIKIPLAEETNTGKNPVGGDVDSALGSIQDGTNVDMHNPETAISTVSPVLGQLGQTGLPSNVEGIGANENIEGNKHDIGSDAIITGQNNITNNLNSSSDPLNSLNDSNLHVNTPVDANTQTSDAKIVIDPSLQNTIKDIFNLDDQGLLDMGIDAPKVSVSANSPQNINKSEITIPDTVTNNDTDNSGSSAAVTLLPDNSTLTIKDSDRDGTLKTNKVANDDSDIEISKHKDRTSIVFPDKLNEAKDKIQKQKNESQLSKLNDINGQILYAVNIGPSITPTNQGFYVSPSPPSNSQQVYVNSPSGTPAQYVSQNPSNTVSTTAPSGNIVSTNANGGSPSGGYTMVNVPANGNTNSGQALYNYPSTSAGQTNSYYQVPNNPTQQAYYTVQLSNGQIALVPVSNGQYVQSNGQGQMIMPSNGQQYVLSNGQPVQSTGQIVYLNGQQYVPTHSHPVQGSGQVMMTSNGQQYIPSSGQPMQGILVSSNGQQYLQTGAQPTQGNGQIVVQGNGQQYVQSNGQPANGQYIVSSNGQNYVPSGQVNIPWSQGTVQNNGQVYVPLNNQNSQNIVAVPAGSIVTVEGSSGGVPLMVFKDKDESSPKPSVLDDEKDDEIDEEKDEIKDEPKDEIKKKTDDDQVKVE